MENEPKASKSTKLLLLILFVLFALVCVVLVILVRTMKTLPEENTETQAVAAQTETSTPIPTISVIPTVTVSATEEPSASPEITATPIIEEDAVWINLSYLIIRAHPDFSYGKIGHIPYGERVTGKIDGLWMYTTYDGVTGYIYVGKLQDTGRPCVVYSESELLPLN